LPVRLPQRSTNLLGDAFTQTPRIRQRPKKAYRKAVDLDPSELGHLRGWARRFFRGEIPDALSVYQKLADLMPDDADCTCDGADLPRTASVG